MIFHTVFTLILVRSPELTKNIVNRRTLFYIIRNYFFSRLVFRRDRPSPRGSVTPWHSFLRNPSTMPSPPFLSLSHPSLFFSLFLFGPFSVLFFTSNHHILDHPLTSLSRSNFIVSISPTLSLALSSNYFAYHEQHVISNVI